MNWKNLIWIIPLVLIIGFVLGANAVVYSYQIKEAHQFCDERQYKSFSHFERRSYEGEELLFLYCVRDDGLIAVGESFPVYNEVFQKVRN